MSYMDIMARGGGIASTVEATRQADLETLVRTGRQRLDAMLAFGVTTVEGKSGYGLDRDTEIRQLEAMAILEEEHPIDVVATFLGAHAVPREFRGRADAYLDFIMAEVLPWWRSAGWPNSAISSAKTRCFPLTSPGACCTMPKPWD